MPTTSEPRTAAWMRQVAARPRKSMLTAAWPALPEKWLESARHSGALFARTAPSGAAPFAAERIASWLRDYFESRAGWTRCMEVTVERPAANSREKPITLTCWDNQVARLSLCLLTAKHSLRANCLFRLDDPTAALQQLRRWVEEPERHIPDALTMLQTWAQDTELIRSWSELRQALSSNQPVSLAELAWHCDWLPAEPALEQRLPDIIAASSWQALSTYGSSVIAAPTSSSQSFAKLILACETKLPADPSPEVALTFLKLTAPLHVRRPPAHGLLLVACTALRGLPLPHAARPDLRALLCDKASQELECSPFLRAALDTLLKHDQLHALAPMLGFLSTQGRKEALEHVSQHIAADLPPSATTVWLGSTHTARPLRLLRVWGELMGGNKPAEWQHLMALPPLDPGLQPLIPPAFWKAARDHLSTQADTQALLRELYHWAWQQLSLPPPDGEQGGPERARLTSVFAPNKQLHATIQRLLEAGNAAPEELQVPLEDIARELASQQVMLPRSGSEQGIALQQIMRVRFRLLKSRFGSVEVEARLAVARALTAQQHFWSLPSATSWLVGALAHASSAWCAEAVLLNLELGRKPWTVSEASSFNPVTFDDAQWQRLCHHLRRITAEADVSAAVQWLDSLAQLSPGQRAAVDSAWASLQSREQHCHTLACAALLMCVNPSLARSTLPTGFFADILQRCLEQNARNRWHAVEKEAVRLILGKNEVLAPRLHAELALDLAERWATQLPDIEHAQRLWTWCQAVAAHPAMQQVWIEAAALSDVETLRRWRACWAGSSQAHQLDQMLSTRAWSRLWQQHTRDDDLMQELWIQFPNQRPLPALDWWKAHCAQLLVAENPGVLSRLLQHTDAGLHLQLLTHLRGDHPEGSDALATGLLRFAEYCLNSDAKLKRWNTLNKELAPRHARGPIMEDVLLDIQ